MLTGATRLELATSGVTGRRSNQLNYAPGANRFIETVALDTYLTESLLSRAPASNFRKEGQSPSRASQPLPSRPLQSLDSAGETNYKEQQPGQMRGYSMEPTIIRRDQHPISRKLMPQELLKVLYRLHRAGHIAYLCGGGVRDLFLLRSAGDFDVATDAEPRRLKQVFANCRLVGRRFQIAHILFKGGKIIEVSTFRKKSEEEEDGGGARESLLIKRDNTYGTPVEDAFRRDFTINALYYNIADYTVIDYVGGRADLEARLIRSIGDPDVRFQEDPIRILRGIRLAACLDFRLEQNTWQAMIRQRHHLLECAVSRSREEIMKMLQRGNTRRAFGMLVQAGLVEILLPRLHEFLKRFHEEPEPLWRYLEILDDVRISRGSFSDSVLLATLTAAPVAMFLASATPGEEVGQAIHSFLEEIFKPLAVPRLIRNQTALLHLALRHMLAAGRRRRKRSLRNSPVFQDALKFLEVHCRTTNEGWKALEHWRHPADQPRRRRAQKTTMSAPERASS
jgi:poly(A) polymerase